MTDADGADRRALLVDAFTDRPLAGNAAGVVPDAAGLSDSQMQAVARELGASETAFLLPGGSADRRVRYFTPTTEVDLCGHATIASHGFLHDDGTIGTGTHSLETNTGTIEVEVADDGTVWMTGAPPAVERVAPDAGVDHARVGDALGVDPAALADVGEDLPLAVASTGLSYLIVPVNFLEHLSGMAPEDDAVEALCEAVGATGVYAFTFDTLDADATLHGRTFAPLAGVSEDPVTGTASGAVGAYLRQFGAFDGMPEELRLEQGHFLDRPGTVRVRAREEITVGGAATVALDGRLRVPPDDGDDGIIEA
jgi:PhzF family phenazine biosynthesis protein